MHGPMAAVGLLCAVAIAVGIKGILLVRMRGRGQALESHEWYEYAHRGSIGNIASGGVLFAFGAAYILLTRWVEREHELNLRYWFAPTIVGLLQLGYGVSQRKSRTQDRRNGARG